jgi:hypothetical protein
MAVKFKIAHTVGALYEAGEIAGFDAETEADLVKREIAEEVKADKAPAPKP